MTGTQRGKVIHICAGLFKVIPYDLMVAELIAGRDEMLRFSERPCCVDIGAQSRFAEMRGQLMMWSMAWR